MCPNCKKNSYCGCGSCRGRKRMKGIRTQKLKDETVKCPYCRKEFSIDGWEDFNYENYKV